MLLATFFIALNFELMLTNAKCTIFAYLAIFFFKFLYCDWPEPKFITNSLQGHNAVNINTQKNPLNIDVCQCQRVQLALEDVTCCWKNDSHTGLGAASLTSLGQWCKTLGVVKMLAC